MAEPVYCRPPNFRFAKIESPFPFELVSSASFNFVSVALLSFI